MASGSFSGSAVNGQDPYLFWSYTQDVATRKTTLTLTLKVKRLDNNYSTNKENAPYNIQCPNNTVAKSGTFDYDITDVSVGSYLTIGSVVKVLDHGTDGVYGAGSISVEGQLDLTGTSVGDLTTGVDTITIPDIPVESTVETVTGSTMGGTLGITLDAASSGFTHNLTYAFGSLTGTIVNGLTGSLSPSYNWNTSALRNAMIQESPSSASKSLTITCKTYSGSTLLGTTTKVVTLYVPSDAVPTISSVSNEDALQILGAALKTWYVQSKSKPKVLFQCAGYLGSSIVSRELKINGVTVSNALVGSYYEGTALSPIAFSSGNVFRVTVTDSRGKTATTGDVSISQVAAYSIPGFTSCLVQRCLQDGTLNGDGTWLKITPNWYYSSVVAASVARNAIATKNWKIGTGANTAFSSGDNVAFIVSNGTPAGADGKFAINSSYLITVTITDTLGGSAVMAITVPSAKRLLSLNAAGTGVAVGKAAEVGATNFECDLIAQFNKGFAPIAITTSANLNDLQICGFYRCAASATAATLVNCPTAIAFHLFMQGGGSFFTQTLTEYTTTSPKTWTRNAYWNGTTWLWSAWSRILDTGTVGITVNGLGSLTSSTLVGADDTLLVSDGSDLTVPKKLTIDSLFAFFKIRDNYFSTEVVNSDVTSVIDDYLTLDADWTIGTLKICRFGPMVSLYINATRTTASGVGNIGNDTVATIKDASLRPTILTTIGTAATGDMASGYIDTAGVIGLSATRAAITAWSFGVTYLI